MRDFVCTVRTWVVWTAVAAALLSVALSPVLSYFFFEHQWDHCLEVILLTPMVIAFLVAEGECSLLKGMRKVRSYQEHRQRSGQLYGEQEDFQHRNEYLHL